MISVGRFAELAQVSARTVRYYESIGLLPAPARAENNYRYYDQKWLERMNRIRDLQSLGFSLEDIKQIVSIADGDFNKRLQIRLKEIDTELFTLQERRERILNLLSVANKIETGDVLTETEKEIYMENIREEIIKGLQSRYKAVNETTLAYLERDGWILNDARGGELLKAVKKCVDFAKEKNLKLGTARGSASSSLSLYSLGFSEIDPLQYEMVPERYASQEPFFHIDVEFERGQEFVDFCKDLNRTLSYGEIQAFKMPLIDIVQNVQRTLDKAIDFDAISDDDEIVLKHFRNADIEKIFQFDFSDDALVMNFEKFLPEYRGLQKITEYLKCQSIESFREIVNITALWRPNRQEMIERVELYKEAKKKPFRYEFLSENLQNMLKPNHGRIIYHEDLIKIISEYTGWDFARSNLLRRLIMFAKSPELLYQNTEWMEFNKIAPKAIVDLVETETKYAFCQPHAIAFAKFTKQTAILKSLHKEIYYAEIEKFEQKHGVTWDDIGIKIKGVSLHQG